MLWLKTKAEAQSVASLQNSFDRRVLIGSADGHQSGAIKLPVCGIRDSSQIHRMVVDAVVVIKKTVSDVQDILRRFPSNICSSGLRLGEKIIR